MKFNIQDYYIPLIESGVLLFVLFVLRQILKKGVRNFTHKVERLEHRTALIIKHVNITIFALVILGLIFIWGVDFRNIGLVFSSVFAVIGIADRKSTRLNSSHVRISYAVFCLKKKTQAPLHANLDYRST